MAAEDKIDKEFKKKNAAIKKLDRLLRVSSDIMKGGVEVCGKFSRHQSLCVYEFKLIDKKEINAFADGETIYVTTGMMNFAKTDNDLAIVLGHEYAHNMMEHIGDLRFNMLAGAVIGSLFDGMFAAHGVDSQGRFSEAGAKAGLLSYSKEYEAEADYVGLYVATLGGFNIKDAPNFWRRMAVREPDSIYIGTTHPTTPERFLTIEKTIAEINDKKKRGAKLLPDVKTAEIVSK